MKAEELIGLESHELSDRLKTSRRELYELRFQVAVGQLENNREIRKVKKDIARILTVIRSRELAHVAAPAVQEAPESPKSLPVAAVDVAEPDEEGSSASEEEVNE